MRIFLAIEGKGGGLGYILVESNVIRCNIELRITMDWMQNQCFIWEERNL